MDSDNSTRGLPELIVTAWRNYEEKTQHVEYKGHQPISVIFHENKFWETQYGEQESSIEDKIRKCTALSVYTTDGDPDNLANRLLESLFAGEPFQILVEKFDVRRLLQTRAQNAFLTEVDLSTIPFKDACALMWLELSTSLGEVGNLLWDDDVTLAKSCLYHFGVARYGNTPTVSYLQKEMLRGAKNALERAADRWMNYRFEKTTLTSLCSMWDVGNSNSSSFLFEYYVRDYSEIREELSAELTNKITSFSDWGLVCENLASDLDNQDDGVWINLESGGVADEPGPKNLQVPKESFAYSFLLESGLKNLLFELFRILSAGYEPPTCSFTDSVLDWFLDFMYTDSSLTAETLFDENSYDQIYDIIVGYEFPTPPDPAQEIVFTTTSDRMDLVRSAQKAGFSVYCCDGEYALTIDGGGYSFMDEHYIPLFLTSNPSASEVVFYRAVQKAIRLYQEEQ